MEKFTNGTGAALTGSPFNHFFYSKVFELLLRMKANFLWPGKNECLILSVMFSTTIIFPAQWSSAFGVDDSQNQPLADWFGIVMGTRYINFTLHAICPPNANEIVSHEEPMMRSIPVEWGLFGQGDWKLLD